MLVAVRIVYVICRKFTASKFYTGNQSFTPVSLALYSFPFSLSTNFWNNQSVIYVFRNQKGV